MEDKPTRRPAPSGEGAAPRAQKRKIDFSSDFAELEPTARALAAAGDLPAAVRVTLDLEKRARLAADQLTGSNTAVLILDLCLEQGDYASLNANVALLCRRRGQFRQVQIATVERACSYVHDKRVSPLAKEIEFIQTIREVAEGRIFLEVERARCTLRLARIYEDEERDLEKACSLIQEEQIESYGEMPKREKFEFILEQMRLAASVNDWIRNNILAQKVTPSMLDEPHHEALKIQYHKARVAYHARENATLDLARQYLQLYGCPTIREDATAWRSALASAATHVAASPADNLRSDLLHSLLMDERLGKALPEHFAFLTALSKPEIVSWPLAETADRAVVVDVDSLLEKDAFLRPALKSRVVEHNVNVVAKYYDRITFTRLAQLLRLTEDEAERAIARMVTPDADSEVPLLIAKMDRPAGIVRFGPKPTANSTMTQWAASIDELLALVDDTTRLVHKEFTLHANNSSAKVN